MCCKYEEDYEIHLQSQLDSCFVEATHRWKGYRAIRSHTIYNELPQPSEPLFQKGGCEEDVHLK